MALSLPKQRAVAAVVGGFVADAASMGLHWIYDDAKLAGLVAAAPQPEFHEPPACPFYEYKSGVFSPYGDEVYPLLKYLASRGTFVATEYSTISYEAAKSYTGRLNGVFRQVVAKGDAGESDLASENKDLHGAIKVPILVAKYLEDTTTLVAKTKEATRVHQIGDEAREAAVASALLLQQVVLGTSIPDAIKALATSDHIGGSTRALVQEVLDTVASKTYADAAVAINTFGKSCPLPGSLKGALYVLLTSPGYVDAVRTNMVAGGDNCSRSIVIGACAAAAAVTDAAVDPIPDTWKQKTSHYSELAALAKQLVA